MSSASTCVGWLTTRAAVVKVVLPSSSLALMSSNSAASPWCVHKCVCECFSRCASRVWERQPQDSPPLHAPHNDIRARPATHQELALPLQCTSTSLLKQLRHSARTSTPIPLAAHKQPSLAGSSRAARSRWQLTRNSPSPTRCSVTPLRSSTISPSSTK